MGVLSKRENLYADNDCTEIVDEPTGIGKKLKRSILSGGGLGVSPWDTGGLAISIDNDICSDTNIVADSISSWPCGGHTRDINSRIVVPLPHGGSREDMMLATEHARRYIANAIAEQMIAAGVIQFTEHREIDNYFGEDRLVVEGTFSVPYRSF